MGQSIIDLGATLSVRNVSGQHPLVLMFVRYFDSAGQRIRDYISAPSELGPLGSVEFVVEKHDTAGGPGANFLVQWCGTEGMDTALIEAVMIGQSGNAGISFTTTGREVRDVPR
jgi:hypothetical protein